ncbi:MAG: tetratricopeptide repeat protein [Dysgonomonas sp.]
MKQILFIITFTIFATSGIFAQKVVRDSIRTGNKAYSEQRYHEAESNYKSAINQNPASKEASYNLANTYYKQSRWDDALKEYQHYLTLETDNTDKMSSAWHNIGNTMLKKKDLKQSMEAYKNALRLNPADEQSRYNLAVVQKIIKDKEDNKNQDQQQQQQQNQQQQQDQNQQQQQQQNKPQEKKPEEQDNQQMSRDNVNQILQAIEQDEKETQEKVQQMKAAEKKQQNENNRRQNKDW